MFSVMGKNKSPELQINALMGCLITAKDVLVVTAAVSQSSPHIKETKERKTCHILAERLQADNIPPAVSKRRFALCGHTGGLAATYGLTDKS